jgi:hypothetical protein
MDKPPFSLAFVMVKESFAVPARLFYLASDANKNKRQDHLKKYIENIITGIAQKFELKVL